MGYITKEQRENALAKLNKAYTGKKIIILVDIIVNALLLVLLLLSLLQVKGFELFLTGNFSNLDNLTIWGWVAFGLAIAVMLFDLFSVIAVFLIKSPKMVYEETVELISTPVSGRSSKAPKWLRERTTVK